MKALPSLLSCFIICTDDSRTYGFESVDILGDPNIIQFFIVDEETPSSAFASPLLCIDCPLLGSDNENRFKSVVIRGRRHALVITHANVMFP